jgi:RNA polymerase sigma factor (sigma-70 family)
MPLFLDHPELLQPFREGRREVLERVYRTYRRSVERNLRASARAHGAQEVFLRAFSEAARTGYDGRRAFAPYLGSILRNCLIDALRARGREVLREPGEPCLEPELEGVFERHDEVAHDPKLASLLTNYVAGLPPALASIYWQRFVLGQSQVQTSLALGLSRGGVRNAEKKLCGGLRLVLVGAGIFLPAVRASRALAVSRRE